MMFQRVAGISDVFPRNAENLMFAACSNRGVNLHTEWHLRTNLKHRLKNVELIVAPELLDVKLFCHDADLWAIGRIKEGL